MEQSTKDIMSDKIYVVKYSLRDDVWEDCDWESIYVFATDDLSVAENYVAKYKRIHDKAKEFYIHPMRTTYWKTKETEDTPEDELKYQQAEKRWFKVCLYGDCYIHKVNYIKTNKH